MSNFTDVLKTVAPTIATVLGGPLAGMAVSVLGEIFGISEPTQEKITDMFQNGQMSGEQIVLLRTAEMNLKIKLKELDIKLEELEVQDRSSARGREVSTNSKTTPALAWIIVCAFIGMVYTVMFSETKIDDVLTGT